MIYTRMMEHDPAIDTLLDLHDSILDQGDGYWIKIEAWRVNTSDAVPRDSLLPDAA